MMPRHVLLALVIVTVCCCCIEAAPSRRAVDTPSFIASLGKLSQRARRDVVEPAVDVPLDIQGLRVSSSVTARFTRTVVESIVVNPANTSQEINFYMELPKEAFISDFLIETGGVVYNSRVDEKEKAQQAYDHARSQGQTTGQVKQTSEEKNDFTISINVEAESTLSFNLTYEELLERKNGYFENAISISPGQTVEHLIVDVHIIEPQGIKEESVDFFVKKQMSDGSTEDQHPDWAQIKGLHRERVSVQFHPTVEDQEALATSGNLGKFVVRYDVIHEATAGDIQIVNGYFVHHFSPEGFTPTQKNVVFVLDTSGSMSGTKIRQTKEAMEIILSDLREKDQFGIVTFSSTTRSWRNNMVPASKDNIESAKDEIRGLHASGGTNLHGGIVDAIAMLEEAQSNAVTSVGTFSLIIMLTDGQPTSGSITNPNAIKYDIRRRLEGRFSLFCLGFGNGVNYPFLEQLSLQNRGLARKIYEDSDAGLQLVGFFDEVASPLLVNIKVEYDDSMVVKNSISETSFPSYFEGTELVVAGQLLQNDSLPDVLTCTIRGGSGGVEIELELVANVKEESDALLDPQAVDDFAQRLWAFLTIKELLRKRVGADGDDEKAALTQRALELSLKYHFVTPLTSLVVVKPDHDEPVITDPEPELPEVEVMHPLFVPRSYVYTAPISQPGPWGSNNRQRSGSVGVPGPIGLPGPVGVQNGPSIHHSYYIPVRRKQLVPQQDLGLFSRTTTTSTPQTTTAATASTTTATPTTTQEMETQNKLKYRANFVMYKENRDDVALCFNVRAKPGQVYQLVEDSESGLAVSGRMASAYVPSQQLNENDTVPLILDRLVVTFPGGSLEVSPDGMMIGETLTLTWDRTWKASVQGVRVSVRNGQRLIVQVTSDITVVIRKHAGDRSAGKADFLGLHIEYGEAVSTQVDGLIGQFERREIHLDVDSITGEDDKTKGDLMVGSQLVEAHPTRRMDLRDDRVKECWWYAGGEEVLEERLRFYRTRQ